MGSYWIFSILLWATIPPSSHQRYDTLVLPVPYATEQACKDSVAWLTANTPRVPPPAPDTKIVYVCIQI